MQQLPELSHAAFLEQASKLIDQAKVRYFVQLWTQLKFDLYEVCIVVTWQPTEVVCLLRNNISTSVVVLVDSWPACISRLAQALLLPLSSKSC